MHLYLCPMPTPKKSSQPTPTIADELRTFITRFVYLSNEAYADILALYVLHTHAFGAFKVTPYIYLNSAERGSGKTTTLEVLHELCAKAEMGGNISAAALYAMVESVKPTLLIDEVDAVFSGAKNEDMRGMLNSGYNHRGGVIRNTGISKDENDPGYRRYSTFCPKVMAGIDNGLLPDTIQDRSIVITLRRANREQFSQIEDFYIEDQEEILNDLIDKVKAWVAANGDSLMDRGNRPARLNSLGPRQNQIAAPLLAIAARLGNGWFDRAKVALTETLGEGVAKLSPQATALLKVRDWFTLNPDADRISSATAVQVTESPARQVGIWFSAYGVKSQTLRFDGTPGKGWLRSGFADAFERYLPTAD